MKPGNTFHLHLFNLVVFPFKCIWFFSLSFFRPEEQMASGGRPPDSPIPQVPRVFPQTSAVHLVVTGDPHHQDRVLLHCSGLSQRGMKV